MAYYKVELHSQQELALSCNACQSSWSILLAVMPFLCLSAQHVWSQMPKSSKGLTACCSEALCCVHLINTLVHCTPLQGEYHCTGLVPSVCGVPIMAGNREAGVLLAAMEVCNTALPPFAAFHNREPRFMPDRNLICVTCMTQFCFQRLPVHMKP